jgi:hypothetical protein
MSDLVGGGVRSRVTGRRHREQVGLVYVGDGDYRVVLGRLRNGEAAGRWIVAGCRPGVPSRVISNSGHPLQAETVLDAKLISRYGVPPSQHR